MNTRGSAGPSLSNKFDPAGAGSVLFWIGSISLSLKDGNMDITSIRENRG